MEDALDQATVRCFVDVAEVVGLTTVAEFVATSEVQDQRKALGVDSAQGYLVHKPEPLENLLSSRLRPTG